jgi:hypothetical protein
MLMAAWPGFPEGDDMKESEVLDQVTITASVLHA